MIHRDSNNGTGAGLFLARRSSFWVERKEAKDVDSNESDQERKEQPI
jgi:hypothetical protein